MRHHPEKSRPIWGNGVPTIRGPCLNVFEALLANSGNTTKVRQTNLNQMAEEDAKQRRIKLEIAAFGQPVVPKHGRLTEPEKWWNQHYEWFKARGYLLRSRYSPDWTPSWLETKKDTWDCDDGRPAWFPSRLLDATRLSDGAHVVFKRVNKFVHPFEVEIGQYFSSESLAGENNNHCVTIYDVLQVPEDEETNIIVMPLLSEYTYLPFRTVGEAVECFRQLFEGLLFMHKHRIAHRDCTSRNVMVDPTSLYIDAFHPVNPNMKRDYSGRARFRTRTEARPKYILIDFGLSRRYDASVLEPKEDPIWGADKTVPEFQDSNEPRDPFPTDVYYIGNMIRKDFLAVMHGLEFMCPLIVDMIQEDPSKRPTMQQVVDRFQVIQAGLSTRKLRSRVVYYMKEEGFVEGVLKGLSHWMRLIKYIAMGIPALPTPSS